MLKIFQVDLCHFRNTKGRYLTEGSNKYDILIVAIRRASLEAFCVRELGKVRGNLTMLRKMGMMDREELVLEYWLLPL